MSDVSRELPKYQSHKQVWALKIAELNPVLHPNDGSAFMTPAEEGYAPFKLDADYMQKHTPHVGGYYVVYADGYKSFSPAEAFEGGYTAV